MDAKTLQKLLRSRESPCLEFKQEWYKLESENDQTKKIQKNELIKDILSLANGNIQFAGETAYLIIGADDRMDENGERKLYDIAFDKPVTSDRLLKIVNRVCDPPLSHLDCFSFLIDSKSIFGVEITPSPHVYEITEKLETSKRPFDEYTVFTRKGDQITTASSREREVLARAKELKFNQRQNAPSGLVGFLVGATVGAILLAQAGQKYIFPNEPQTGLLAGVLAGIIFGGIVGFSMGYSYVAFQSLRSDWKRTATSQKIKAIFFSIIIGGIIWIILDKLT